INIIDTKNYGVPQTRQRAILLISRKDQEKKWEIPSPTSAQHPVSIECAIGSLPSLDPQISDVGEAELLSIFPSFYRKKAIAESVSILHRPPKHIKRQVITMMHTPTGKTAFDNEKYIPIKANGMPVSGYKSTYRRLRWCDPASTVTMDNRKISSQNNVHPGRYIGTDCNGDVLYSDPRALTVLELMRIMSLPDDWPLPGNINEAFLRSVIGEGIPPLFVKKVFENIL
ncbi:MAG: DNA cytosine methyltransferase, partial [Oscillospiraceae bacterium]